MKFGKATERDIEAAGDAMSVLNDIASGYYPARGDQDCPTFFNKDEPMHLRAFYDLIEATLDKSPGWPVRVIGGMCFVILFDKNQIVDPAADVLELHPRFYAVKRERDALLAAMKEIVKDETPWGNRAASMARTAMEAIAQAEGGAQ